MSSWSQTPNGITGVFYGRRCDVVRRGGAGRGTASAFRANVEGIDEGDLRNKGYARDYKEGKQICFDALAAAGLIPPKGSPSSPGSSRYAPHPIEIRARAVDQAVALHWSKRLPCTWKLSWPQQDRISKHPTPPAPTARRPRMGERHE